MPSVLYVYPALIHDSKTLMDVNDWLNFLDCYYDKEDIVSENSGFGEHSFLIVENMAQDLFQQSYFNVGGSKASPDDLQFKEQQDLFRIIFRKLEKYRVRNHFDNEFVSVNTYRLPGVVIGKSIEDYYDNLFAKDIVRVNVSGANEVLVWTLGKIGLNINSPYFPFLAIDLPN